MWIVNIAFWVSLVIVIIGLVLFLMASGVKGLNAVGIRSSGLATIGLAGTVLISSFTYQRFFDTAVTKLSEHRIEIRLSTFCALSKSLKNKNDDWHSNFERNQKAIEDMNQVYSENIEKCKTH
jgi:hypothetical protein